LKRGITMASFWRQISCSPAIQRYGPGLYGLIGSDIEPGTVDVAREGAERVNGRLLDHGWTDDGRVWLKYVLSAHAIGTGIMRIPAARSAYLEGRFRLRASDGTMVGTLQVDGGAAFGLVDALRYASAEPGDVLIITIDRAQHDAEVRLGGAAEA
jgi:hypothetical protein